MREAGTNAVKHAHATETVIDITMEENHIVITASDNGRDGADPGGIGLSGPARRVAAIEGRRTVDSPAGGPTTVAAVPPCG